MGMKLYYSPIVKAKKYKLAKSLLKKINLSFYFLYSHYSILVRWVYI